MDIRRIDSGITAPKDWEAALTSTAASSATAKSVASEGSAQASAAKSYGEAIGIAGSLVRHQLQAFGAASATAAKDPKLAATKMTFSEDMKGYFAQGNLPYKDAERIGKSRGQAISFHANMKIDNMDKFLNSPSHEARIEGYIDYPPLGGRLPITEGKFNLFAADPDTGERQMRYQIKFKGADGKTYLLDGTKFIKDERGFDLWSDNTTLFAKIYEGGTTNGRVVSTGILRISLRDTIKLVQSINIQAPDSSTKVKALKQFGKFFFGSLLGEYVIGKVTRLFSFLNF